MEHELYFSNKKDYRKHLILSIIQKVITYTFLTIMAIIMLFPFYWMITTSLKGTEYFEAEKISGAFNLFPKEISLENYKIILFSGDVDFFRYFGNTIFVALCTTAIMIVTTILAAFAFARLNFKGKNVIFAALLATMMVPGEIVIMTNYQIVGTLHWYDTYWALIIPHSVSVFYIFYLRQTFEQIPNELYLAAKVDGVGDFKYLLKVMIPIASPTIVTIVILSVMGSWNAYIWPQLVANKEEMRMVANGLMELFTSEFSSQDNIKLAASCVVTAPLFIFFLCFRKYIMKGVSRSGIKG